MDKADLDDRRQKLHLTYRDLGVRAGIQKDRIHRYFRPIELTREELHRVEAALDAELARWEKIVAEVGAKHGIS